MSLSCPANPKFPLTWPFVFPLQKVVVSSLQLGFAIFESSPGGYLRDRRVIIYFRIRYDIFHKLTKTDLTMFNFRQDQVQYNFEMG